MISLKLMRKSVEPVKSATSLELLSPKCYLIKLMIVKNILLIVTTVGLRATEGSLLRIIDAIRCTVVLEKMEEISTLRKQESPISKLWPMFFHKFNVLFAKIFWDSQNSALKANVTIICVLSVWKNLWGKMEICVLAVLLKILILKTLTESLKISL